MPALVTVVMAAYNSEAWVAEAVESALGQDHKELEVIVVNDGSTDSTLAVLQRYGERIRVINQRNAGAPAARNAGLAAARGDFVAFLDADDVWWPGKVSDQVAFFEGHPEVGTVVSSWQVWAPDSGGRFYRPPGPDFRSPGAMPEVLWCGWRYNELLFDCELLTTCVMLRAETVRAVGRFDTDLRTGEDYDYWLRASRVAPMAKLARPGALYRVVPTSLSREPRPVNAELDVLRQAVARWGRTGPDGRETTEQDLELRVEQLVMAHGWLHLQRGDASIARRAFVELLRRHPGSARLWWHLLRSVVRPAMRSHARIR